MFHRSREQGAGSGRTRRALLPALSSLLLVSFGCSRDHRTPLVIYSPHGRDLLTLFERRFEALHPDIDVRWLDMGSQDVYDRLRSEKANPQADVWFGGPSLILAQAAADSLLDCRRGGPVWADAIAPRGRGEGDCFFAAYETPAVFLYAEKVVPAAEAPQDWDDLLDPRWKGKIIMRDPLASGTMRAVFGFIVARAISKTGDTAAGFAWLRRLDGQTKVYEQNPALISEKIARQEGLVTIWDLPDVLISRRRGARGLSAPGAAGPRGRFAARLGARRAPSHAGRRCRLAPAGPERAGLDAMVGSARARHRGQALTAFLQIHDIAKRWSDSVTVGPITLDIARGEILALLGPSGSGKTTMLRLLAGFETADRGR